ncbi:hypothetical protein CIK99_06620 [Prevotella sp. P5-92]|uniref:hypothetical protein n=1 Tax=Prevotella sp. P5-92 TaxID=2024222 RepID=UPI000B95DE35|nr:hypothetical protein [Prevotella sp. P5-92]OYP57629.1 hypothetical protein CIK99_06620 [Prevotella sp. P5-92]
MKYEITITPTTEEKDNSDLTLSLNTADGGQFEIKSYGTTMNFSQFIEFADAIQEIREKFAVINGKHEERNGRTN